MTFTIGSTTSSPSSAKSAEPNTAEGPTYLGGVGRLMMKSLGKMSVSSSGMNIFANGVAV